MKRFLYSSFFFSLALFSATLFPRFSSSAVAAAGDCATYGKGAYCGADTECLSWWVDPNGMAWCQQIRYIPKYIVTDSGGGEQCVNTGSKQMCPVEQQ